MPLPDTINAYSDVRDVLDLARQRGGGVYRLPTAAEAVRWRLRAYTFRKLYRKENGGYSPYDNMTLRLDGTAVSITINVPLGTFEDLSGEAVPVEDKHFLEHDELFEEAERLRKELGDD